MLVSRIWWVEELSLVAEVVVCVVDKLEVGSGLLLGNVEGVIVFVRVVDERELSKSVFYFRGCSLSVKSKCF